MTRGDQIVERAAEKLELAARKAAERGGLAAKVAAELGEDAQFLRKLKPSLIAARAKGEAPTDGRPAEPPRAPSRPQLTARPKAPGGDDGPNPLLVVGIAFALGVLLAKLIDWRGHAHPRR